MNKIHKLWITSLLSFPHVVSGNPDVSVCSTTGCPITAFGHDRFKILNYIHIKTLLMLFIFLFTAVFLFAQDEPLKLFDQANGLYQKGEYSKAIEVYKQLIAQDQLNAPLYYNLGNAYYKNQQMGLAILYYEKALRLNPRDSDTRYNIDFINRMLKEPSPSFFEQTILTLNGLGSLNELMSVCSFLFITLVIVLSLYIVYRRNIILAFSGILFIFLVSFGSLLFIKTNTELVSQWVIVVAGPAEVRNGPGFENSIGFNLPEGKKILILGQKDDWAAVGLKQEGLKGWLEKKYINEI